MKHLVFSLGSGIFVTVASIAVMLTVLPQGAVNAAGQALPKILFENERVKISMLTLEPGQATPVHTHDRDEIVICLESSKLRILKPGPEPEAEIVYPTAGTAFMTRVKGVAHVLTNAGDTPYKQISIELK